MRVLSKKSSEVEVWTVVGVDELLECIESYFECGLIASQGGAAQVVIDQGRVDSIGS